MGQFIVSYGKFANEKDRGPVGAPHDVSEKTQHVKLARKVLQRNSEEGNELLQRIVATDETWMRPFEP